MSKQAKCPHCGCPSKGPFGNVKDYTTDPPTERCISFDYDCGSFEMDGKFYRSSGCEVRELTAKLTAVEAEVARLQADKERLDWIQAEYTTVDTFDRPTGQGDADVGWVISHYVVNAGRHIDYEHHNDNVRDAIDAAMNESNQ